MALPPITALSFCAGVGGLDLGLQLAHDYLGTAFRGVCYVEREVAAAASLVASMEAGWLHPAPVWSDARTFDGAGWRGCVDIVTSGDPCQGNSVAGKRKGELDDRWLLDRAIDVFDASGASAFFRENVPGNADGQLAVAIPALERLGCRVATGIFSSSETGNTMRRERLFILAERDDSRLPTGNADDARQSVAAERSADVARPIGHIEARREPASGKADRGGALGQSGGPGGALARPNGRRGRNRNLQRGGEFGLQPQSDGSGGIAHIGHEELGRTNGPDTQGQQRGQHLAAGRQVKGRPAGLSGRTILPPAVIPGPTDTRGWIDLLDRHPEFQPALSQEEAESHLRRGIDAMANRIERLRATGNGVDPLVAATAFLRLRARLDVGATAS